MKRFTVQGTNFHCGYQLGKHFRREIRWRLQHQQITEKAIARHQAALQKIYRNCQQHFPQFIEEIKGMAQGSRLDFWQLFHLNCPELFSPEFGQYHHGCSSIAVVKGSEEGSEGRRKVLLAHNEDGDAFERKDKCALITFKLPSATLTSFVYLGELPGNAYSWNSYGLFFTVNYVPVKPDVRRIPYYFLTRALAEAKTIPEAVKIQKNGLCASGFHAYILQGKRIVSVEVYRRKVSIKEVKGIDFHTNHFLHPGMRKYSEQRPGSVIRLKRLQELITEKMNRKINLPGRLKTAGGFPRLGAAQLKAILSDRKNRPYPLYSINGDKMRTLSTVVGKGKRYRLYGS